MLFTTIDAGQKDGSHIIMRVFLFIRKLNSYFLGIY